MTKKVKVTVTEEEVPLTDLYIDPKNANIHPPSQIETIKKSLSTFGQPERLVVALDGKIIGGNGRFEAMIQLGWKTAKVTRIDADDAYLTALGLALNKTAEGSFLSDEIVAELLTELSDNDDLVFATGFSEAEITSILNLDDDDFFDVDDLDDSDIPEEKRKKPTASADGFSSFEVVLRHENKVKLVEALDEIRKEVDEVKTLEDALMYLLEE